MLRKDRPRAERRAGPHTLVCLSLLALFLCVAGALKSPAANESAAPASRSPDAAAASPGADKTDRSAGSRRTRQPDPDAPGPDAQYVGSGLCGAPACHGAMMADFRSLRHSHYLSDPKYKDAATCELCHGPASNHVADPQHRHIYRFSVQTPENTQRLNEACLQCHREVVDRPHFLATEHARAGVSCASCHEVHYPLDTTSMLRYPGVGGPAGQPERVRKQRVRQLSPAPTATPSPPAAGPSPPASATAPPARPRLVNLPKLEELAKTRVPIPNWRSSFTREPGAVTNEQAVNELCASCHRRELTEFRQFSHHPLFEGRMKCTDCHDPHRAERGRMLVRRTVEETCFQCHQHIRGPFAFEHEPVKTGGVGEACLECHRPHGSPNRRLHTLFSRGLCVQCHADIQHDPAHQARGGDCWRSGCHVAIHGSNHSPLFFVE
jgi:predicted CXXCH cytochrome family protein